MGQEIEENLPHESHSFTNAAFLGLGVCDRILLKNLEFDPSCDLVIWINDNVRYRANISVVQDLVCFLWNWFVWLLFN